METMGFLKKLPLFPVLSGSGNFSFLILITALETSCIVGAFIFDSLSLS